MPAKVVVVVSGGNVQVCYSDDPQVEVQIIDFDNIADGGNDAISRAEADLRQIRRTAHQVY